MQCLVKAVIVILLIVLEVQRDLHNWFMKKAYSKHLQHFQACTSAGSDLGSDFVCDRSTTSSVAHADWKAFEINTAGAFLWLHHSTAVYGQISLAGTLTSKAAASGTRHN